MGRFDKENPSNQSMLAPVMIVTVVLLIIGVNVLVDSVQTGEIKDLQKKLELIEPIIDDYCLSSPSKMDFCHEVLQGYNHEVEKAKDPVTDEKFKVNIGT